MKNLFTASAVAFFSMALTAQAATITNATAGTGTAWSLDGYTSTGANSFTLDLTVLEKHSPFDVVFDITSTPNGVDGNSAQTNYLVTLNITNGLPTGPTSSYMSGFDLLDLGSGAFATDLPAFPAPTSDVFGFENPVSFTTNLPGGNWRFGGLNGGGTPLASGATAVVTFTYTVATPDGAGAFVGTSALQFVANPEPGSIVLAALALIPCGVVVRRRRQQKSATIDA